MTPCCEVWATNIKWVQRSNDKSCHQQQHRRRDVLQVEVIIRSAKKHPWDVANGRRPPADHEGRHRERRTVPAAEFQCEPNRVAVRLMDHALDLLYDLDGCLDRGPNNWAVDFWALVSPLKKNEIGRWRLDAPRGSPPVSSRRAGSSRRPAAATVGGGT